ncbi:MAG: GNAT family N-acetyltransferase [Stackebrandtia sp.]
MSDSVKVRPAAAEDDAALVDVEKTSWTSAEGFPSLREPDRTSFIDDDRNRLDVLFVAELDGEVVGYIRLAPLAEVDECAHVLNVPGLAVAPRARGRGVAAAMLAFAEGLGRSRGARKIQLGVFSTNAGAVRVYERAGFEVEGRLRDQYRIDGEYVDAIVMAKHLG